MEEVTSVRLLQRILPRHASTSFWLDRIRCFLIRIRRLFFSLHEIIVRALNEDPTSKIAKPSLSKVAPFVTRASFEELSPFQPFDDSELVPRHDKIRFFRSGLLVT